MQPESPDETSTFPNGHADILEVGGGRPRRMGGRDEPAVTVDWFGATDYAR